jgi:acyl dehydratase
MSTMFTDLVSGTRIAGEKYAVSRGSIRQFAEATLDFNPLHLDDEFMKQSFGKTHFGGIIMHGLTGYGLLVRMLTDWAYPNGGLLRRIEVRWLKPVRPGDTIHAAGVVKAKRVTDLSRWTVLDIEMRNQHDEVVSAGEAHVEFPEASR